MRKLELEAVNSPKWATSYRYQTRICTGTDFRPSQVHYVGTLESTGAKFDSSYDRGTPLEFPVGTGKVIKGYAGKRGSHMRSDTWDEGLLSMREGGKRRLIIPPHLGYGSRGAGNVIPPNATLVFVVELVGVKQTTVSSTVPLEEILRMKCEVRVEAITPTLIAHDTSNPLLLFPLLAHEFLPPQCFAFCCTPSSLNPLAPHFPPHLSNHLTSSLSSAPPRPAPFSTS
eukprot:629193-Hanusia_phi.AAC.1